MARRPDIFDREWFEEGLRAAGCPDAYVDSYAGDFKLFVPLLLRELGEEKVLEIVERPRVELGLKEKDTYWKDGARYFVTWARNVLDDYKVSKGVS